MIITEGQKYYETLSATDFQGKPTTDKPAWSTLTFGWQQVFEQAAKEHGKLTLADVGIGLNEAINTLLAIAIASKDEKMFLRVCDQVKALAKDERSLGQQRYDNFRFEAEAFNATAPKLWSELSLKEKISWENKAKELATKI